MTFVCAPHIHVNLQNPSRPIATGFVHPMYVTLDCDRVERLGDGSGQRRQKWSVSRDSTSAKATTHLYEPV